MNLCIFFEGTGQGVAGRITNVTRLYDLCVDDARQKLHLESGPGTRFGAYLGGTIIGIDWRNIFRLARRWFESSYESLPKEGTRTDIFLFGFSRGALLARHFAAWLDKLGLPVTYLGLWDTVDATVGLDVAETCPPNVKHARHAVSRDETRRFFRLVAPKAAQTPCWTTCGSQPQTRLLQKRYARQASCATQFPSAGGRQTMWRHPLPLYRL